MLYKYKILSALGLIIHTYENVPLCYEVEKIRQGFFVDESIKPEFVILIDLRDTGVNAKELDEYLKWISELVKQRVLIKRAVLATTPMNVAKSELFKSDNDLNNMYYKTFSTVEASLRWLNIAPLDFDYVRKEMRKLTSEALIL